MFEDCLPGGLRHAWYDYDFDIDWEAYVDFWLTSRCERCESHKVEGFDASGKKVRYRLIHSDGYKKALERKTTAQKNALRRLKAKKVARRRIKKAAPAKKATTRLRRVK